MASERPLTASRRASEASCRMIHLRLGSLKFTARNVVARLVRLRLLRPCVAIVAVAFTLPLRGETESPLTEYQVEAAFLYQFAKYVTWPPQAFATPQEPLLIGVLGDDPFGDDLARAVAREKAVQGHPLRIMRGRNAADLARCQILFISGSEEPRIAQHLTTLERLRSPALTVGESQNFLAE